jgi:hypothetical protein
MTSPSVRSRALPNKPLQSTAADLCIPVGPSQRGGVQLARLREQFGAERWRKRAGVAMVRLVDGRVRRAELHWYEAHGIVKRKIKVKRFLE